MRIIDIINHANKIADEDLDSTMLLGFLNDAVAKINVLCGVNLPFAQLDLANDEYVGFPETWQRALLVPYMVGRIKQTDSSQFEYTDAYGDFLANVKNFLSDYDVPEEYLATKKARLYADDFSSSPWGW